MKTEERKEKKTTSVLPGWSIHLQKDTTKPWHHKHLMNATKCHSIKGKHMFSPTLYLWGEQSTSAPAQSSHVPGVKPGLCCLTRHVPAPGEQCAPGTPHVPLITAGCPLYRLIPGQITCASVSVLCSCPAGNRGERCFALHSKTGRMKIRVQLKNLA